MKAWSSAHVLALVVTVGVTVGPSLGQAPSNDPAPNRTESGLLGDWRTLNQAIDLLKHRAVQDELKLTAAQAPRFPELRLRLYRARLIVTGPQDDQEARRLAEREASEVMEKELRSFLSSEQYQRLEQMVLQVQVTNGWGMVSVFRNPIVVKELNLGDAQWKVIESVRKEIQNSPGQVALGGPEKDAALRQEHNERIESALTEAQKAKWKAMLGPEMKVKVELRVPRPTVERPR